MGLHGWNLHCHFFFTLDVGCRSSGSMVEQSVLVVLTNDNMASTFFSEQVKTFCQLFAQTEDLSQSIWWPKYETGPCSICLCPGSKNSTCRREMPTVLSIPVGICLALHRYFKELKGVAYRDLPDVTFSQSLISGFRSST